VRKVEEFAHATVDDSPVRRDEVNILAEFDTDLLIESVDEKLSTCFSVSSLAAWFGCITQPTHPFT
jgi:hypothetical protein